jgi:MFS family permease
MRGMRGRIIAGSCGLAVSAGWNITNVGAVADSEAAAYGVALAVVGLFTTTLFVGHLVSQVPSGRAVDALGARRVGLAALVEIAACNTVLLAAPSPALALGIRGLMGLGTGAVFVAGSDYARTSRTPLAQGIFGGASIAGSGLAVALMPALEHWLGWRAPYWTALVLAAVAVPILFAAPSDSDRPPREAHPEHILSDRRLYRLGAVHGATFGLSVIAGNWIVTLLTRTSGLSDRAAGLVGTFVLLGGLVTRPLGGVVMLRRPGIARTMVLASIGAGAVGTALLAVLASPSAGVALLAALVAGAAAGMPFVPVFTAAQRLRPDAPGAAVGLVNAAAVLVILVGTPLVGLSFSLPGDGRIGFAVLAALWASALLLVPREL